MSTITPAQAFNALKVLRPLTQWITPGMFEGQIRVHKNEVDSYEFVVCTKIDWGNGKQIYPVPEPVWRPAKPEDVLTKKPVRMRDRTIDAWTTTTLCGFCSGLDLPWVSRNGVRFRYCEIGE